ncbi:MAG: cupin domain-containing protein [Pseudomonadota bacterium]|nr:cupin domain-containing protein [Pseudomonadota bacterium]
MTNTLADALKKLPLPATTEWPEGRLDVEVLSHGTMTLEVFAPGKSEATRKPHFQDRLYIVTRGQAVIHVEGKPNSLGAGNVFFVRAGSEHRFDDASDDFAAWIVSWGPEGGEAPSPHPSVFAAVDA